MTLATIHSLPDEIIAETLSYVLIVPDEKFARTGSPSSFGHNILSSSVILLVNKRWLRVATPLVYECVVLRSTPQAETFWKALRGKAGPQLQRVVRRMRLEGSFGAVVGKILCALPSITDLFLKLPSHAEENIIGIVRGLPMLNPRRVIFEFTGGSLWKHSFFMAEALCAALRRWDNLQTFKIHIFRLRHKQGTRDAEIFRLLCIGKTLAAIPRLRFVILSFSEDFFLFDPRTSYIARFLEAFGGNSSLRGINLVVQSQSTLDKILEMLLGTPYAKIVQCSLSSAPQPTASSSNALWRIPQLPENVLRSIIDFDLRSFLAHEPVNTKWVNARSYKARILTLFMVSKAFYKLSYPLAPRFISIQSSFSFSRFTQKLLKDEVFRDSVETVKFERLGNDVMLERIVSRTECMTKYYPPNVHELSFTSETAFAVDTLAYKSKQRVRRLRVDITRGTISRRLLSHFNNVTELIISSERSTSAVCLFVPKDRLRFQNVISLHIIHEWDLEATRFLQSCDFPSARFLDVILPNYEVQDRLQFEVQYLPTFPSLQVISLKGFIQEPYVQLLSHSRSSLEKMVLSARFIARRNLRTENENMTATFNNIDFGNFKALKELQITSVDEWPWQDQELKDSAWQRRAQALIDAYGFKITNASGIPWKPRMVKQTKK